VENPKPQPHVGDVLDAFDRLGPNGQRLLLAIAKRLVLGQERYGDFPMRPWNREAAEEALDAAVYLAASLETTS
jgi:hypothetical protein